MSINNSCMAVTKTNVLPVTGNAFTNIANFCASVLWLQVSISDVTWPKMEIPNAVISPNWRMSMHCNEDMNSSFAYAIACWSVILSSKHARNDCASLFRINISQSVRERSSALFRGDGFCGERIVMSSSSIIIFRALLISDVRGG